MKYPFTKCLNPRIIVNRYTGEEIEVGCGVCKACLLQRSQKFTQLCSIEEADHKYCVFFTLTYSDEFVPMAHPVVDDVNGVVRFVSSCSRLHDDGQVICVDVNPKHCTKGYLGMLEQKTHLQNAISYTSVREAQLFMKRLRKRVKKYSDEKLRYYIVSEYGPKTFRAHYHGMLFCDDEQTYKAIAACLRPCWPYGRIDYSLSRGKCASYVARYVNSTYFVPPFLGNGSSKPFSLHSTYFAVGFYKSKKKEIYENAPERFVRIGRVLGGKYVDFMPWRSLATTFYPRCKGYNVKTHGELLRSYSILREVRRAFGISYSFLTFPQIADNIIDFISGYLDSRDNIGYLCKRDTMYTALRDVSRYFLRSIGETEFVKCRFDVYQSERVRNMIVNELYISRHFLDFVCDHDTYYERDRKVRMIEEYWKAREYANLVDWYSSMAEFTVTYPTQPLDFFYVNKPRKASISSLMIYKNFAIDTDAQFERSIKHKRQNVANAIFINS